MMGLPEFIKRALAFFDKSEAQMQAETELNTAKERIAALEKELAEVRAASPDGDVEIKHKAALDAANAKTVETEKALADFKAQAAKDLEAATNRANEVLASMGIDPSLLPTAGQPSGNPAGRGQDPVADLRMQLKAAKTPSEKFTLSMQLRKLTSKTQTDAQ